MREQLGSGLPSDSEKGLTSSLRVQRKKRFSRRFQSVVVIPGPKLGFLRVPLRTRDGFGPSVRPFFLLVYVNFKDQEEELCGRTGQFWEKISECFGFGCPGCNGVAKDTKKKNLWKFQGSWVFPARRNGRKVVFSTLT